MNKKYFGTDGIRGLANKYPMDAETALKVGKAAGAYFTNSDEKHRVVIGKDTRLSGYLIEPSLTAGFVSMGMDVILVGPVPTPALSMLTRSLRADLGVMISASHNAYHDNGIKFFDKKGRKLSDKIEKELEDLIDSDLNKNLAASDKLGKARRLDDAQGRYIEYVKSTFPKNKRLDGLKVVIDCANGAAYKLAPDILWELGAEIIPIAVTPNGFNINDDCGSTHTNKLQNAVIENKADIGIALDGDADRLIVCDENGSLIDGDQIIAAIATYWNEHNRLKGGGVVTTVMSNMGLEKYLESIGVNLERTNVGDRYVIEKMLSGGFNLGGEQSGHLIFNDFTTTGDGTLAALQTLAILVEKQLPASEILNVFTPYPQILKNIKFDKKNNPLQKNYVQTTIQNAHDVLGDNGRVLIRESGTEPLIRVMIEGNDLDKINSIMDSILKSIEIAQGE